MSVQQSFRTLYGDKIKELYEQGKSTRDVARELGIGKTTVARIVGEMGRR